MACHRSPSSSIHPPPSSLSSPLLFVHMLFLALHLHLPTAATRLHVFFLTLCAFLSASCASFSSHFLFLCIFLCPRMMTPMLRFCLLSAVPLFFFFKSSFFKLKHVVIACWEASFIWHPHSSLRFITPPFFFFLYLLSWSVQCAPNLPISVSRWHVYPSSFLFSIFSISF